MNKKVIAIGNRIMGDDGIGIVATEYLQEFFTNNGFEVIIGETDVEYCLNSIKGNDFIIIVDASYSGLEPGQVSMMSLREAMDMNRRCTTQHESNLLSWLSRYGVDVEGAVICIEAYKIELHWGLSKTIEDMLPLICEKVKGKISYILGEGYYA